MNSAGDAFGFPFRSPRWGLRIFLQGLIFVIPVIGQIAALGWLLHTLDNLRAGRQQLAPAGFYLGRGIGLFGVQLVYGVVIFLVPGIVHGIGLAMVTQGNNGGSALVSLGGLLELMATLFFGFLLPALILRTGEGGFGAGMDVAAVWRLTTANVGQTVIAALLIYVAEIIASLGLILCVVGFLFTSIYAYGVMAGIVSWHERAQGAPGAATAV